MEKTALITGISGQDGSYLSRLLVEKGYKVVGTVRSYKCTNKINLEYLGIEKRVIIEELDLLDISNILRLIQKYKPVEIYNLAAQSSVSLSFEQPLGTFSFNTISVNNLLESIRLLSAETKLYQASTSEIYGKTSTMPINKYTRMYPASPYAVSKMAAHFMIINYRESYNLFACNGILFNHESFLRSENFFVKKIIKNSILIKNNKLRYLEVGDLSIKRDFGYAPLYVEAMWKMLQLEKPIDCIICSGKSIMLQEIVDYVLKKIGLDNSIIVTKNDLFRPNEIRDIYGDNSEAKDILDWNYNISFFDVIDILVKEELDYYKKNF